MQTVSDGPAGLTLLNSVTPELVLLDVALGEDSGIDVLREIRRKNATLPVILVTEDMGKAFRALARDPDLPTIFHYAAVRQRILRDWQIMTEVFPLRSWVYYGDPSNNIVVVPEWPAPEGYDLRERSWYRAAIATDGIAWVEPYTEYGTGEIVFTASIAIRSSEGTVRGVPAIDTFMEEFLTGLERTSTHQESRLLAVSRDGSVIASNKRDRSLRDGIYEYPWRELIESPEACVPPVTSFEISNGSGITRCASPMGTSGPSDRQLGVTSLAC